MAEDKEKAALLQQIADLEKMLQEQTKRAEAATSDAAALRAAGAGWLVTTPNPGYDGEVYGIAFKAGQAWIAHGRKIAAFEFEPLKASQLERMSEEDRAGIREREKISSAARCVEVLQSDFGYKVEWFGPESQSQTILDQRLSSRAAERRQYDQALAKNEGMKGFLPG